MDTNTDHFTPLKLRVRGNDTSFPIGNLPYKILDMALGSAQTSSKVSLLNDDTYR